MVIAYSKTFVQFIILRTLIGATINAQIIAGYTMAVELIGFKYRALVSSWIMVMFIPGYVGLSVLAYSLSVIATFQI